ncbi:MAG: threonine synthase [Bacteroidetes bacterium]|nr:threonine synthase [Bacteroidota bacterium]MDA1120073.1 threonine synthase [Bacteroidota bacterium]
MQLYSTNHQSPNVTFKQATFKGLPNDNGLFMPKIIPQLEASILSSFNKMTFTEIAHIMAYALIGDEISRAKLEEIVIDVFDFNVPLAQLDENIQVLELFHGPTHAFKDFGARFMARVMSHFLETETQEVNILVATSGDTGSAVAQGFVGVPGISVTLLYPSGKVSGLQEMQLTTIGQNITAIEVSGTFDDCQKMVKQAFLDPELSKSLYLTSANSINIARLIPQSFYYMYAWSRTKAPAKEVIFSVPCGNFGNLCGGLISAKMGMPVNRFIAATNINKIVPEYLDSGSFNPRPSVQTIANAMDVGNPSNFPRIEALLGDYDNIRNYLIGAFHNDEQTLEIISEVHKKFDYFVCPHTAIGYGALKNYLAEHHDLSGICLGTAHPAKFFDIVIKATGKEVEMPYRLKEVMGKEKISISMGNKFDDLKGFLLD